MRRRRWFCIMHHLSLWEVHSVMLLLVTINMSWNIIASLFFVITFISLVFALILVVHYLCIFLVIHCVSIRVFISRILFVLYFFLPQIFYLSMSG